MAEVEPDPSFCFAAAGWMKVWYYGVGKALQERVDLTGVNFAGSSAGSLVSVCLLIGVDFDDLMDYTVSCVERCRTEIKGPFKLRDYINECFDLMYKDSFLPLVQDRLNVYVTDLPIFKPRRINKFRTNEELKFWVTNSCNMPLFVGWPERADQFLEAERFVWVFDGGATKFCPVLDENSITISVFGKADIRPSKLIPLQHGLYPPPPAVMREYYEMGYRDANTWLSNAAYSSPSFSPSQSLPSPPLHPLSPPSSPSSSPSPSPSTPPSPPSSLSSLRSLSSIPSISLSSLRSLSSLPSLSFSSQTPPSVRHKLMVGKELIPPPMERRRDFFLPQLGRSLWEITLLLFSFWVLFPLLFVCTGVEKVVMMAYANMMLGFSFVAHMITLCQSKTLGSNVSHYFEQSTKNFFHMVDPRLFLGYLFPALSRYIGTRHLDHEEFANMSFVYRYFQDTWLLKRYKGFRKEDKEGGERSSPSSSPSSSPASSPSLSPFPSPSFSPASSPSLSSSSPIAASS